MRSLFLFCVIGWFVTNTLTSQTYVGEIRYRGGYEYMKVVVSDQDTVVSFPYIDGKITYPLVKEAAGRYSFLRKDHLWRLAFDFPVTSEIGTLQYRGQSQPLVLRKQLPPIAAADLERYEGVFQDSLGQRTVIYAGNAYLHVMSPYSERTMSLKPVGKHRFWTVSGALWEFQPAEASYQLQLRNDSKITLQPLPEIKVEEHWIPVEQDTLFAKVFYPPMPRKAAACLVLPGGGAVGMKNYEYEARYFAAQGLVAMVFDKSGNGRSKGDGHFRRQAFSEKKEQYIALYRYLQKLPMVDSKRVGVHGPSEGGRLALMMAASLPDMAFVNATAAPIMSMREGQLYAVAQYHRNLGLLEADINAVVRVWNDYYEGILNNDIPEAVIERANTFRDHHERMFLPPNSTQVPVSPSAEDLTDDSVVHELSNIACPIFLQYGENDERVHALASIQNVQQFLAPNTPCRIERYPRANHSFMTPEFEISHGYLDDKLVWLQQIGILKRSP